MRASASRPDFSRAVSRTDTVASLVMVAIQCKHSHTDGIPASWFFAGGGRQRPFSAALLCLNAADLLAGGRAPGAKDRRCLPCFLAALRLCVKISSAAVLVY